MVQINPEARVSVARGPAPADLVQHGWKAVLVQVHNAGALRGRLEVESPNAEPALHRSTSAPRAGADTRITDGELANRFLELVMYRRRPMLAELSGLSLEYAILQINSKATASAKRASASTSAPAPKISASATRSTSSSSVSPRCRSSSASRTMTGRRPWPRS